MSRGQRSPTKWVQPPETWWLHPAGLTLGFMLPLYLFIVLIVPQQWPEVIVLRARNYLDSEMIIIGAVTLLVLGLGALLGSGVDLRDDQEPPRYELSEGFLRAMGLITLAAYLIWFWPIIKTGQFGLEREELNRLPGVTSFSQVGVSFVVSYLYLVVKERSPLRTATHWLFRLVILFTLARVYIWSERLALIEVATPALVVFLTFYTPGRAWLARVMKVLRVGGPFLGVPLLFGFFAATEVVRSWKTYSQTTNQTLTDFVVKRITTYYFTALNNGAGLLETTPWPEYDMIYVLDWLYRLPVIGSALWQTLGRATIPHIEFLHSYADPEFNNMSGIYTILFDTGLVGGVVYFGALGFICGLMYRALRRGEIIGVMLYPPMFVACLEVMRIPYLNGSRVVLVLASALVAAWWFRRVSPSRKEERFATGLIK